MFERSEYVDGVRRVGKGDGNRSAIASIDRYDSTHGATVSIQLLRIFLDRGPVIRRSNYDHGFRQ